MRSVGSGRWPKAKDGQKRRPPYSPSAGIAHCPGKKSRIPIAAKQEYYSGSHWHWFDKSDAREVRAGDRVAVQYNIEHPEESVFLRFL